MATFLATLLGNLKNLVPLLKNKPIIREKRRKLEDKVKLTKKMWAKMPPEKKNELREEARALIRLMAWENFNWELIRFGKHFCQFCGKDPLYVGDGRRGWPPVFICPDCRKAHPEIKVRRIKKTPAERAERKRIKNSERQARWRARHKKEIRNEKA